MPIRRRSIALECSVCEDPIPPGEVHRGPDPWNEGREPVICWSCACAIDNPPAGEPDQVDQGADQGTTEPVAGQRRLW